ncbi:MAG: hypothetical protein CMJ34_07640 [Phycisphaerae bacterium]|nr:hypothetical protein [Phycisphaerae bacterium]
MTLLPLLFWAMLLVPGYSVARRLMPDELEGGLLPGLAVSWVTCLGVLAPFIVIGYLIGVPIWIPVVLVAAFVLWGCFDIASSGVWRKVGRLLLASVCIELVLLGIEFVFSVRHGSILAADARVHLARIRFLFDHGLTNLDPFVGDGNPYPIYHTNIHHAMFAVGSRIVGVDPVTFWFGSLAVSKMMIASGMAYLAWAVLGGRWAAWIVAVMVLVNRGPVTFSLYPNQLAPWFLLPVFLGVLSRVLAAAWRAPDLPWWSRLPRLAGISVVIGMFHPLYAGFAVVVGVPVLLVVAGWRLVRRRPGAATALVAFVVLVGCAMPFPFAGKLMTVRDREVAADVNEVRRKIAGGRAGVEIDDVVSIQGHLDDLGVETAKVSSEAPTVDQREKRLLKASDGWVNHQWGDRLMLSRELGRGFTGAYQRGYLKAWRVWFLVLGGGLAILLAHRREAWYLMGAILVIQAVVLVPPLATAALRFLGAQWMLQRFETLSFVFFLPLSIPAIAAVIEGRLRGRLSGLRFGFLADRLVLAMLTLVAIPVSMAHASHRKPYDWEYYWNRVSAPLRYRHGREYRGLMRVQEFMQENIPAGSVVAVDPFTGTRLKMLHDIRMVASERSSTGVVDGGSRRIHLDLMFDLDTEEESRAELFRRYGVTHVVSRGSPRQWVDWWDVESVRGNGYIVSRLDEEPDLTQLWKRNLKQGVRMIRAGRHDEAVDKLRLVVLDDPRLEKAWFHLGRALRARQDSVLASESFGRAAGLDPDDLRYPFMEGLTAFDAERYPAALDAFDRARRLALKQEDTGQAASSLLNMGNTRYMLGQLEDAIDAYDAALELDEEYEKALEYRGIVAGILAEEAAGAEGEATEADGVDQSEEDAGRPASPDENTPSARPTP